MITDRRNEVIRDATLTLAHILKTWLRPRLDGRAGEVAVFFDVPDARALERARGGGKVPISMMLVDAGNIDAGHILPRWMITPWEEDPHLSHVLLGEIMRLFAERPTFHPEEIQGSAIRPDPPPRVALSESVPIERQMRLWVALGGSYRPSLVVEVELVVPRPRRPPGLDPGDTSRPRA